MGRGEIREAYFTREERELLQRALSEGRVVVCEADLHLAEGLWQRGYLNRPRGAAETACSETVFLPTGVVERVLKTTPAR